MDYAIIDRCYALDTVTDRLRYGYGNDAFMVYGWMKNFARIIRMCGIREIHIIASETQHYNAPMLTLPQAEEMVSSFTASLLTNKTRGKKTYYQIKIIDPYTCATLRAYAVKV